MLEVKRVKIDMFIQGTGAAGSADHCILPGVKAWHAVSALYQR